MFAFVIGACIMTYSDGWPVHDRCIPSKWSEYRYATERNCQRAAHAARHAMEDQLVAEFRVAFVTTECYWVGDM